MNKFDQIEEALVEIHRREYECIEDVRKKDRRAIVDASIEIIAREAINAMSELRKENERMRRALGFYADDGIYVRHNATGAMTIEKIKGKLARSALGEING